LNFAELLRYDLPTCIDVVLRGDFSAPAAAHTFLKFVDTSPTHFLLTDEGVLQSRGFTRLEENAPRTLVRDGRCFCRATSRRDSPNF
jgi:hypothetical protein